MVQSHITLEAYYDLRLAVQKIKDNTVKLTWPFPEGDSLTKGFHQQIIETQSLIPAIVIWKCCCLSVIYPDQG